MRNPIRRLEHGAATMTAERTSLAVGDSVAAARKKLGVETKYVDVTIQFIGASQLSGALFFHATLDDKLSYVSSVQPNTLAPMWNEVWQVKNVPTTAMLSVIIRDHAALIDNYVGKFVTTISPGAKEAEIHERNRGTFWLKVDSSPSRDDPVLSPYLFDGPVHYSSHSSPTIGALTKIRDNRLYTTWKIYIKGVPRIFGDQVQHWNRDYKAAQSIFQGPASIAIRSGIRAAHRMLYARSAKNTFGVIQSAEDVFTLFRGDMRRVSVDGSASYGHRIKPAVYTYVICTDDDSLRFSETGAAFFVDFASKHALHSNCAKTVRYSGELHLRPVGGWARFSESVPDEEVGWELVIDNNSLTYSPDPALLPKVKEIVELNFAGFEVVALRHDDPALKASTDACRAYAMTIRNRDLQDLMGLQLCENARLLRRLTNLRQTTALTAELLLDRRKRLVAIKTDELAAVRRELDKLPDVSHELASARNKLRTSEAYVRGTHERYNSQLRVIRSAIADTQPESPTIRHFITVSDSFTEYTIIQTLERLNLSVEVTSTFMARFLLNNPQLLAAEERSLAVRRASKIIAPPLVNCLATLSRDGAALLLPVAFRAYLISRLSHIISSFTIAKGHDELLGGMYRRVQDSELQISAMRWRSLAYASILIPASDADSLFAETIQGLSDIALAAGYAPSTSSTRSTISPGFKCKISYILLTAERLARLIWTARAANLKLAIGHPGQTFDGTLMEFDHRPGSAWPCGGGRKILCTTHLGLTKEVASESSVPGQSNTLTMLTMVRAKVLPQAPLPNG